MAFCLNIGAAARTKTYVLKLYAGGVLFLLLIYISGAMVVVVVVVVMAMLYLLC